MPKDGFVQNSLLQHLPSFKDKAYDLSETSRQNESLLNAKESQPKKMEAAPRTRRAIGGRGREWASECLKLLEALLELDDSKPVKEPVNPLKFPEYYTDVANPIDLSKVMLKFHGGAYSSLDSFTRDMRQMFNNYKNFFKEANAEIYTQVHRLSWWFEAELTRIQEKFGKTLYYKGQEFRSIRDTSEKRGRPPKQTPLYYEETQAAAAKLHELSDIPVVEKRLSNRQLYYRDTVDMSPSNVPLQHSAKETVGVASPTENNTNIIVSINHGPYPMATNQDKVVNKSLPELNASDVSRARHQRNYSDPNLQRAMSHLKPSTVSQLSRGLTTPGSDVPSKPKQKTTTVGSERPVTLATQGGVPTPTTTASKTKSPRLSFNSLIVELTVSNIWFGTARIKPRKPALLSEEGLQIWWTCGDHELPFTILADEIVRVVAHFGRNSNKHTLFVFVLPSCSKRLETLNEKYTQSSMIVVFLNIQDSTSLSTLMHIFWNIGQRSMFGSIFSEVDQKGALLLLGNIKPGIMSRVASKYKGMLPATEKSRLDDISELFIKDDSKRDSNEIAILPKKRKRTVDGTQKSSTVTSSRPADSSVSSQSQRDSRDPSTDALAGENQLLTGAPFDKDFAQKLGASLHREFKEGVTEVLKNLTDALVSKALVNQDRSVATSDKTGASAPGQQADDPNDESDIEIIIPTDSDDEEVPYTSKTDHNSEILIPGEEDLAVTGEKISIRCPITQQVMEHPLKNKHCGHCYDRQGVEGLILNRKQKSRCPVAGCSNSTPLDMNDMAYEYELWKFIQDKAKPDFTSSSSTSEMEDKS